jgi:hypothetical protein
MKLDLAASYWLDAKPRSRPEMTLLSCIGCKNTRSRANFGECLCGIGRWYMVLTCPRKHIITAVRCDIVTMKRVGTMALLLWSMEASAQP